jgi:aspartyl-tRNA(Asn)/glutamyl-tRNA(Gln) amidotransferase subunit C
MDVSPELAAKVATLARLRLDADKLERFAGQMHDILNYMETLAAVDTTGVEPLYGPVAHASPTRPDEAARTCTRDEVLRNAPESDGRFFIVPKIV